MRYNSRMSRFVITPVRPMITVQSTTQLRHFIEQEIRENGIRADLNHLDVSNITSLIGIFKGLVFQGNISKWDVSNVTMM